MRRKRLLSFSPRYCNTISMVIRWLFIHAVKCNFSESGKYKLIIVKISNYIYGVAVELYEYSPNSIVDESNLDESLLYVEREKDAKYFG